jgi:hypothetical protein
MYQRMQASLRDRPLHICPDGGVPRELDLCSLQAIYFHPDSSFGCDLYSTPLALYPELVHTKEGRVCTYLCGDCDCLEGGVRPPAWSLRAKHDPGSFQRCGLPALRPIEQLLISPYRVYGVVTKVVAEYSKGSLDPGSVKLEGHMYT